MAVRPSKRSLVYPWSPIAVVCILFLDSDTGQFWVFLPTFLATCAEMIIAGYSSVRVMFYKLTYSMLTALLVGFLLGQYRTELLLPHHIGESLSPMAWLSVACLLLANWVSVHTLLKAVKREYGNPEDE